MVSLLQSPQVAEGKKRKRHSVAQVKGNWQLSDDDRLVRLVQELGEGSWSLIAQSFPGRIGKQCRERWNNQLRPDIRRDAWTHAEEVLLIAAHKDVGNRWAEIAKDIPGRTENAVKNHWNATLRKSGKKGSPAAVGSLSHYMRSNNLKHVGPQRRKSKAPQAAQQHTGPSIASNSSNASLTGSDENNDPASSSDGADSKHINAASAAAAFPRTHKADFAILTCPSRNARTCKCGSDSDFSDEYTPSQHASRSSRYTARLQKQGVTPSSADCETALPAAAVRPRTTSLHASTEAPLLAGPASVRHSSQAAPLLASHRFTVPQRPFTGDPRLENMVQDRFAAVASSKAEDEMLLRSLADLVPDDLVNAELSDLDGFCLDSAALHASNPGLQSAATNFQAGGLANPDGVLRSYPLAAQHSSKPLDPRLVRLSQQSHHQQQRRARFMQHMSSDPRQRDPPAALPAASPALAAVNVDSVAQGQAGGEEEVGETGQHVTGVLPGANTSSASSSSDVMGVVPSNMVEDHEQSMVAAAAAARSAGGLLASPIGVQSCDNIHIQMEPLHSLDAYAAKMVSPGMEVAIYSGRCPLAMLTTYQPQRSVQQQVLASLQRVCGWVRAGSDYRVGSLLIAVRAGHVPPGVAGLVIAASAQNKSMALQAVQAAVKQVEAMGVQSKHMQGL